GIPFTGIFVLIGASMIVYGFRLLTGMQKPFGTNVQKPKGGASMDQWPNFPKLRNPKRGPRGATLLPQNMGVMISTIVMVVICILWNAGCAAGLRAMFFRENHFPLAPKLIVCGFAFFGVLFIVIVIQRITQLIVTGSSAIEIAGEPLVPGGQAKIFLYAERDIAISEVRVSLQCIQSCTYGSGKNTHTNRTVYTTRQIFAAENLNAQPMKSFAEVMLAIPEDAIVSFHSSNNTILWEINMKVKVLGKPDIDDTFSLRVAPASAPQAIR
ncbi:MAG: hypothetical protein ABI579_05980, partial [Candidatus Sumerlaeota bacterium]